MSAGLAVAGSIALLVSLAAPLPLIPLLQRLGAHDDANQRSSHSGRALRGLGLGVLIAVVAGTVVGVLLARGINEALVVVAVSGAVGVALLGLAEDLRGVGVIVRFASQLTIGLIVGLTLLAIADLPVWAVPVTAIWFTAYVNFVNFMDGVDGISGGHAVVTGVVLAAAGSFWQEPWLSLIGLVIGASFGGFLPWNLLRRGTFLGDTGSYLLGGALAAAVVAGMLRGVPAVVLFAPLSIYLADTVVTLLRRMSNAEPWFAAHRSHTYQRLAAGGLSHRASATIVTVASALSGGVGLAAGVLGASSHAAAWLVIGAISIVYIATPRVLGRSLPVAERLAPPESSLPHRARIPATGRAVVVGSTGFVGSHVARRLGDDGWSAVAVTAPRLSLSPGAGADDVRRAVNEHEFVVAGLVEAFRGADVVINAAGLADPDSPGGDVLFGANALLPAVIAAAAARAEASRFVHVSSAAVQGRRPVLDESAETEAFSPYSRSKALGEQALLRAVEDSEASAPEIVIVRATSVQGPGRPTTDRLRRIASSSLASVASPGDQPTVVSSIDGLSTFVSLVSRFSSDVPTIVLQPWEGLTTADVLRIAGGRDPRRIPSALGRAAIAIGYVMGSFITKVRVSTYQREIVLFGQAQDAAWAASVGVSGANDVSDVLRGAK